MYFQNIRSYVKSEYFSWLLALRCNFTDIKNAFTRLTFPVPKKRPVCNRPHFSMYCPKRKSLHNDWNCNQVCSHGSHKVSIGSGIGLTPNRRQYVSWTNVLFAVWCHMESPAHTGSSSIILRLQAMVVWLDTLNQNEIDEIWISCKYNKPPDA